MSSTEYELNGCKIKPKPIYVFCLKNIFKLFDAVIKGNHIYYKWWMKKK